MRNLIGCDKTLRLITTSSRQFINLYITTYIHIYLDVMLSHPSLSFSLSIIIIKNELTIYNLIPIYMGRSLPTRMSCPKILNVIGKRTSLKYLVVYSRKSSILLYYILLLSISIEYGSVKMAPVSCQIDLVKKIIEAL